MTGYNVYRDGTLVGTATTNSYNDTGLSPATLHSYWISAYDAAGNVSTSSLAASAQTQYGADAYGTTWKPLRIGAGGYVRGLDVSSDGTMVARTDTYSAYLWDGTQWDSLVNNASLPAGDLIPQNGQGVYEIRIAPSNTSRLYMMYAGYLYRSDSKGALWTKTSFPVATFNANDSYAQNGQKMAVDPVNQNIVYAGTPTNGLWLTIDAGTTWSQVPAFNASTSLVGFNIIFDPSSGVSGGKTQGIYAAAYGTGVYHSTDGGVTWNLTTGGPTHVSYVAMATTSALYAAENSTNLLWKYSSGTWSQLPTGVGGNGVQAIAVDPFNNSHLVVVMPGGAVDSSFDAGNTWSGVDWTATTLLSSDIPWLVHSGGYVTAGGAIFDPKVPGKLWVSDGDGVWYLSNLPTSGNLSPGVIYNDQSLGIEQLVPNEIVAVSGHPIVASWDRGIFYSQNPDQFPSDYYPDTFAAGWSIDYAATSTNYLAGIVEWGNEQASGYSTDGGQTWQTFASIPAWPGYANGGTIAVSSPTNIIWAPADSVQPEYTTNGGSTWNLITLPGISSWSGFDWAYYLHARTVTADRVLPNTFYLYFGGLYKTTNGGATWTQVYTGEITLFSGYNSQIKSVPGKAGELYFTGGSQGSGQTEATEAFMHSLDGGATWTAIPSVNEVYDFGFGKAAPGTTTPALYIVGWVNHVYGIFESDNSGQSWTQIGLWPTGSVDGPKAISGDLGIYGRVYIGLGGQGYVYGNTANAQIPPLISAISSGVPTTTAATVTWTTDQSSNSTLVYGTTSAHGSTSSNATLTTSHSIALTGLASGTTFHYAVVSANALGYTSTSTDQTFTTVNNTPPSVPTGIVATATSSQEIDLSWTASTGDGTYAVAGYKIFRNGTQTGTSTNTTFADTGLIPATSYAYTVAAYDVGGNVSAQSAGVSTTTKGGFVWTIQTGSGSRGWTAITSSSDGTKLAAVVYGGDIWTSTDSGVTWANKTASLGVQNWSSITSSSDGSVLAAATVNGGNVYVSTTTGATWTPATSMYGTWGHIVSSSDGTKLVVSGGFGGALWRSADTGATWSQLTALGTTTPGLGWNGLTSSTDGTKIVTDQYNGHVFASSNSGATWATTTAPVAQWGLLAASGDGSKVAGSANWDTYGFYVSTSTATTWTGYPSGLGGGVQVYLGYSSDGTTLMRAVNGDYLYISTNDGLTWAQQTFVGTSTWDGIVVDASSTKAAMITNGGYIWTGVYTP